MEIFLIWSIIIIITNIWLMDFFLLLLIIQSKVKWNTFSSDDDEDLAISIFSFFSLHFGVHQNEFKKKIELNSFSNDDFDSAIVDVCLFVCESDPEIPRDEWKERKIFPFISYLNIKFSLPLFLVRPWLSLFFCYYLKVFSFVILCKIFIRTRLFSFIRCLCECGWVKIFMCENEKKPPFLFFYFLFIIRYEFSSKNNNKKTKLWNNVTPKQWMKMTKGEVENETFIINMVVVCIIE